jgi:hypothetical protein
MQPTLRNDMSTTAAQLPCPLHSIEARKITLGKSIGPIINTVVDVDQAQHMEPAFTRAPRLSILSMSAMPPESDRLLHRREMTRWAKTGLMHCNIIGP